MPRGFLLAAGAGGLLAWLVRLFHRKGKKGDGAFRLLGKCLTSSVIAAAGMAVGINLARLNVTMANGLIGVFITSCVFALAPDVRVLLKAARTKGE